MPLPSATTRLIALLGDPVAHSLSPTFQNAALRAAGLDGVYVALRSDADAFAALLHGIAAAGGAGNVTLPHKERAAHLVHCPTDAVRRTGACNTFWLHKGRLHGDNTDVHGVASAVSALLGQPAHGARVLLLGAGGAARAALCALLDQGVAEVVIHNRTPARAAELVRAFEGANAKLSLLNRPERLAASPFDLIVNATSLGLRAGDALPLPADLALRAGAGLDLVYAPNETAWVRHLRGRGIPAADGLEMLLRQGAAAFERWWDCAAPLEAMRAALPPRL